MNQQTLVQPIRATRANKNKLKPSTIAIYASAFVLLVVMIAIGYRAPQQANGVTANATSIQSTPTTTQTTVDDVVAASVAADVAQRTNLPIAANVANLSISAQIKNEIPQSSDATTVSKPQIVQPTAGARTIISYTTVAGDTAPSVAARYNVSAETIKWANNLKTDTITPGTTLQILPINGVVYTAQSGDTVESIATKYKANSSRITVYNDLDQGGTIAVGTKLIVPDGILPDTERPEYVAPRPAAAAYAAGSSGGNVTFLYWNTKSTSPGNKSAWGNCTWYAYERRLALGNPLPSSAIGNAADWAYSLARSGYTVVYGVPRVGAVMQNGGGLGHVAVVESIADNGDVTVSEMNYGGWYNGVDSRTVSAGQAGNYNYIY